MIAKRLTLPFSNGMKVKQVMKTDIITVNKNQTYREVVKILLKKRLSGLPVVDDQGKLVGLISEKDLFRVLYPFYRSFYEHPELYMDLEEREDKICEIADDPIAKFMTKEVYVISPEAPIMKAGALMLAKNVNRLPVVENGKLVGLVTRRDIYHAVLKYHLRKK